MDKPQAKKQSLTISMKPINKMEREKEILEQLNKLKQENQQLKEKVGQSHTEFSPHYRKQTKSSLGKSNPEDIYFEFQRKEKSIDSTPQKLLPSLKGKSSLVNNNRTISYDQINSGIHFSDENYSSQRIMRPINLISAKVSNAIPF